MYFKKLEVCGFKSFADKTVLNFEPGVTAIVGPNGCGKSNVFDSIRWVLGEQSMKELRGSSREDVIFNGTEKKPAQGFAEVSLSFSNETRAFEIEEDEVTISRRLFRSGESEYLINKKKARLKDIQELLMGTGIGTQAYSMIQQGKVDQVVNAKPEDRRAILDEASGITKYKVKKKEALNKLKAADENLLRVNDISIEVKRQIGSIERQANKARKYKEEYDKLQKLEVQSAKYRINHIEERKNELLAKLNAMKTQEQKAVQELERLSNQLNDEINSFSAIDQSINENHAEEIKLDGQVDLNNRQIGFNQERIESLQEGNQRLNSQKEHLIQKCQDQQIRIEELKSSLITLKETIEFNTQRLSEKREELEIVEKSIKDARNKIKEHEESILNLTSTQVSLRNTVTDIMKEIQGGLARKRRLELELDKVMTEKQQIDQKLQNTNYQINTIKGIVDDLRLARDEKQKILNDLRSNLRNLEETIDNLDKKKLSLKSQKEFIETLHTQYKDLPDPIIEGRIITQIRPEDHHTGILGKVKEVLPISEERLQVLRKELAQGDIQNLYEIICETKFIELDPQQISLKINDIGQEIRELSLRKDGILERIKQEAQGCKDLDEDLQNREKSYSVLLAQRADIAEESKKLEGELVLVQSELIEVKQSLEQSKKNEEEINFKLDTINQDIGWAQNDIKEKQNFISNKSQEKEDTTVAIAQLETELNSNKDKLDNHEANENMLKEALDAWLEEIKKIDDEIAQNISKAEQLKHDNEQLHKKIEEIKVTKESTREIITQLKAKKQEVGERINALRESTNTLEESIQQIKEEQHAQQLSGQEVSFGAQAIKDRLFQTYKIDLDTWEEEVRKEEAAEQATSGDQPSEQTPEQSSEQTPEQASEGESEARTLHDVIPQKRQRKQEPEKEFTPEELQEEVARLIKKCESFGAVNLVAIEEYEELRGRFEFLTKQQSDLIEAKSQLMSTINKINRSTRQMFMDTFTKVSEEFRIYFRMLFGGGEAQLVLLDPEDVLESGIDIIARPPGKKLQNIGLFSGGEKTLTAIALIFGVFKVNPSPFCVLDEIDAALDESNVGRFSYLLKDFSKIAQFIVITHNKKTMSESDVMYGITMPETGVSRVVSVKFSENKQKEPVAAGV